MRNCRYFTEVSKEDWFKIQNESDEKFLENEGFF